MVKGERCRRQMGCVDSMTTQIMRIEPLRDDCAERASAFRQYWAKSWDGGNSLLRKSLLAQLRQRPDIEYKELWPDGEDRRIAAYCLDDFKVCFGLPNERLVPDDTLYMLASIDGDGVIDVMQDLEQEFRFIFEEDVWDRVKTFGELVRYVREHEGSASLAELHERHRIGWGCATVLWLVFAGVIGLTISEAVEAIEAARNSCLRVREVVVLAFSLLMTVFVSVFACAAVVGWYRERKELREEREKAAKK